ncbi:uncharacterized protein B0T23DRAFT_103845 [Neurospora hispaniola]|uniref:Uncharacterized protein n=1 Tax=Neurospora hispaniola TaxID=588809 RepID=A0AAJ0I920_9PEZI|nr:hypothetical protein B0T23DRAFT_103845 [Neurospora hispaniola]
MDRVLVNSLFAFSWLLDYTPCMSFHFSAVPLPICASPYSVNNLPDTCSIVKLCVKAWLGSHSKFPFRTSVMLSYPFLYCSHRYDNPKLPKNPKETTVEKRTKTQQYILIITN